MRFASSADVAVVVPVHNRVSYTARLLSELRRSDHEEALVVVVDDGSTDGTKEYLAEHHRDVLVLPGSGDLWWSGAANLGCRFAIQNGARILMLFNNDNARISANCVAELVRCVESFGGCAASVALEENSPQNLRHAGGSIKWPARGIILRDAGAIYHPAPKVVECEWLPGMALAFSSALFIELDGFDDQDFPQYRGDTDFTLRARRHGKPCVVSYACWITNDPRQSGMNFYSPVSPKSFVNGLFMLRSNYQLRSTIKFARRYCPPHLMPIYLSLFYLRYVYASMKTWLPMGRRAPIPR